MSDEESRREDAKREEWEDAHYYGRCESCGCPVFIEESWAETLIDPASGRALCSNRECREEVEW